MRYKVNNAFLKPYLTDSHCLKHNILSQRGAENAFHFTCKAMTYDLIFIYIVDRNTIPNTLEEIKANVRIIHGLDFGTLSSEKDFDSNLRSLYSKWSIKLIEVRTCTFSDSSQFQKTCL